ncbi:MAG: stalk domain-containing protein [Hominilimicola sp.]
MAQAQTASIDTPGFNYVMDNVKTVSCGAYNTLVVDNSGALWSCGSNTYGQLLNGTTGDIAISLQKVIDSGVKSAATYKDDSIYITGNGELYAAGDNLWGQFGLGWSKTPYEETGKIYKVADNVTDAAIGWQNILYRTSDGMLHMTGSDVESYSIAFYGTKPMLESVAQNSEPHITAAKAEKKIVLQIGSDKLSNNGTETTLDVPAQIIDGRTMVPLRAIFEALDAAVDWDGNTQTITSTKDNITVEMQIGSNILYKNGEASELDVPAQLVDGRTLVPVRAVAESFGADVEWDGDTHTVTINN